MEIEYYIINNTNIYQQRIGNSGADSCKLNICASIGYLCKYWADVFQMPHHRQYVNRFSRDFLYILNGTLIHVDSYRESLAEAPLV